MIMSETFIKDYIVHKKKLLKLIEKSGEALIAPIFKELFENAEISMVRWTQSTPSFNDGEPCEFSVHDPSYLPKNFNLMEHLGEPLAEGETDEDYFSDHQHEIEWSDFDSYSYKGKTSTAIEKFEKVFMELEEVLERIFGNGAEVKVTMNEKGDIVFENNAYCEDY